MLCSDVALLGSRRSVLLLLLLLLHSFSCNAVGWNSASAVQ
jgi:hypothetical protein